MKKLLVSAAIAVSGLVLFNGCASSGALPQHRAGTISQAYPGTVQMVENTQIQGDGTISSIGGMVAGGMVGNKFGGGSGKSVATMAGAMLGGALGKQADVRAANRISVRLDDGRNITTVLEANANNPMNFGVGSRVTVYITNGRVTEIR